MQCPLRSTQLKMGEDGLAKCARFHRIRLIMDDMGYREWGFAVGPKDAKGLQMGDRHPVVDNEETFA